MRRKNVPSSSVGAARCANWNEGRGDNPGPQPQSGIIRIMQCEITIEDLDRQISVAEGELLLTALLSQGVRFAYSCQSGNCGACKCRLVAGEVSTLAFSDEALSRKESGQGIILACRSRVRSDLTIRFVAPPS